VPLTVHGDPIADIVPHERRVPRLSETQLREHLEQRAADPGLSTDFDALVGRTLDEL